MKSTEDLVKEKLEEAIILARAGGMGERWFDVTLDDGTNVEVTVNAGWQSSSYDC